MKYKFIGKPDKICPELVTGKVYKLGVVTTSWDFIDWIRGRYHPLIVSPFVCPYSTWETFYQNWIPLPWIPLPKKRTNG